MLGLGRVRLRFVSGIELDQEAAFRHTWRNRKCLDARAYMGHAEALEAAGLSE